MIWNSLAIVAICLEISVSPLFLYRLNHVEQKVADAVFFSGDFCGVTVS